MGAKATSDFRRRRKANLVQVTGGKCCLCGYDKVIDALEFHHINPEEKEYGIASSGTCHDLEKDLQEVKKCILVCANCHREIEAGLYSKEELREKQIYDEEKAEELRQLKKQLTTKTLYYCSNCGKQLYEKTKTGLCQSCYRESQKRGRPSREELKALIRELPFTHIGEKYMVSDNSVRSWCKTEGLPTKKSEIKKFTDEQWEKI